MTEAATGLILHSPEGVAFRFDPGALSLELLTTGGPGAYARFEVLHRPADLAVWAGRSRLRPAPDVLVTEEELAAARRLRDELWVLAVDRVRGLPPRRAALEAVNEAAALPSLVPRLGPPAGEHGAVAREEALRSRWVQPATGAQLLSTVARDAVELLGGRYADRIRECAASDCPLLFVDTSRPGKRRWCSMERCGNRHKVRALRSRREEEA